MKRVLFLLLTLTQILSAQTDKEMIEKGKKIHNEIFTIDTHVDTPLNLIEDKNFSLSEYHASDEYLSKLDYPRMKEGGLKSVIFAAWVGQGERTPEGNTKAKNRIDDLIKEVLSRMDRDKTLARLAISSDDLMEITGKDKIAVMIGIENGYAIGNDMSNIKRYYDMGVRYITLCHTKNNDICDSSSDEKEHDGLSEFGVKVVKEMNKLGMIIDVSHISDAAFFDVVRNSDAPVIASHSGVRSVYDHDRNMSDEMLKALAKNGGVIQVCMVSEFLRYEPDIPTRVAAKKAFRKEHGRYDDLSEEGKREYEKAYVELNKKYPRDLSTVKNLVDHIDYAVKLIGIDHVGIGTDFDGGAELKDAYDVSQLENVTIELVRRGYSKEDIEKIWGKNFLRVFRKIESLKNS